LVIEHWALSIDVISASNQHDLLALARRALEARVCHSAPPDAETALDMWSGAFVSIFHDGELRGCLGRLNSNLPLGHLVLQLAQAVADSDPRFDRVTPQELEGIGLEISVLTREREIESVNEIEVGRHGLIIESGTNRGLLLPQVATEHRWDRDTFLGHTCQKAGLPADAWKRGARIFVFEAEVFGERAPKAERR
jgi:AmmeMemoRadiSam system protein A